MNFGLPAGILLGLVVLAVVTVAHLFWSKGISSAPLGYGLTTRRAGVRILFVTGTVVLVVAILSVVDGTEALAFVAMAVGIMAVGFWLHFKRNPYMGHLVIGATTIDVVLYTTFFITGYVGPEAGRPTFPVVFPLSNIDRDSLTRHANSLDWSDSAHAVMDVNFMDSVRNGVPVPTDIVGEIRAPARAHNRDMPDLSRGAGAIVWRIRITDIRGTPYPGGYHTADSAGTKRLDLPPGDSYVWVDNLAMLTSDSGTANAWIIPVNPLDSVRRGPPVTFHHHKSGFKARSSATHPNYWWNRSLARWTFQHGAGWAWSDCTSHGCCSM